MMKLLKNRLLLSEDGSGLIIALMTLMVLSVLGASLGTITISGYKMSDTNRDSSSAYYIAEAGANMAYEEMSQIINYAYENNNNPTDFFKYLKINIKNDFSTYTFDEQFGKEPKAIVRTEFAQSGNSGTYILESRANIGNHVRVAEKEVTVNWIPKDEGKDDIVFPSIPQGTALIANSEINFVGGEITGDIYIDSTNNGSFKTGDWGTINSRNIYHNSKVNKNSLFTKRDWRNIDEFIKITKPIKEGLPWDGYKELVSNIPTKPTFINKSDASVFTTYIGLESNIYVKNFKTGGNNGGNIVTIDTKGKDRYILTDNLYLGNNNSIIIEGGGSVTFFVTDKFWSVNTFLNKFYKVYNRSRPFSFLPPSSE